MAICSSPQSNFLSLECHLQRTQLISTKYYISGELLVPKPKLSSRNSAKYFKTEQNQQIPLCWGLGSIHSKFLQPPQHRRSLHLTWDWTSKRRSGTPEHKLRNLQLSASCQQIWIARWLLRSSWLFFHKMYLFHSRCSGGSMGRSHFRRCFEWNRWRLRSWIWLLRKGILGMMDGGLFGLFGFKVVLSLRIFISFLYLGFSGRGLSFVKFSLWRFHISLWNHGFLIHRNLNTKSKNFGRSYFCTNLEWEFLDFPT